MQTQFTKLLTLFVVLLYSKAIFAQQAICHPTLTKNLLAISCNYTLTTLDIDAGSSDYENLFLDKYILTSPGDHVITLTAVSSSGQISSCTSLVTAVDVSPPVVVALNNVAAILNANHEVVIHAEDLNAGSYDCFSNIIYDIDKSVFGCDDLGDNTVTLTATDETGNSNFATVNLNIRDIKNASTALVCNDNVIIPIYSGQEKNFTVDMILEGGPYYCPDHYEVEVLFNNLVRSNDSLYYSDLGKSLVGKIIDPETGNACWGNITVTNDSCSLNFNICDTKARCEPFGECNSGHTDTDNIEWPCDIITTVTNDVYLNPSPENIAAYLQVPVIVLKPELIGVPENCYAISMAYSDEVITVDYNIKKNIRKWTIINWWTGDLYTYVQILKLTKIGELCDLCDYLAWNTPLGDCASGHTLTDAVEWPADITVNGSGSIAALEENPAVNPNDVKPQLNNNCTLGLTFSDTFLENGNEVIITRKWDVKNWNTHNTATFIQTITVTNVDESNRTVCVKRRAGSNIDDVKLYEGNVLESGGCKTFDYDANNKIVTPSKEDNDFTTGIDLADMILLQEFILGITKPNAIQALAGDLNGNGFISSIDAFILTKILLGDTSVTNNFGSPWRFANVTSMLNENEITNLSNSADISKPFYSAHFVGYRLGDVLEDSTSNSSLPITTVILEDEVLNKDEVYEIPVIAKQDYRVKGLQFNIDKSDGFEFIGAGGDYFDNFTVLEYPTHYQVSWMAETSEAMKDGLPVFSGTSMFKFKFRATKNDVMSNSIKFENDNNNRLIAPTHLPSYLLKFGWDNLIPVGTKNIVDRKLTVMPTLINDQFTISFDEKEATMILYNMEGKALINEKIVPNSTINTSSLLQGLYFVTVQYSDGKKEVRKIVKQ